MLIRGWAQLTFFGHQGGGVFEVGRLLYFVRMQKFNLFFKNVFHQLEDISIIPTAQDPRLNTVECVVEGHGSFDMKIFSGFRKLLMHVCWLIAFISVVVGYLGSNMFVERLQRTTNQGRETLMLCCSTQPQQRLAKTELQMTDPGQEELDSSTQTTQENQRLEDIDSQTTDQDQKTWRQLLCCSTPQPQNNIEHSKTRPQMADQEVEESQEEREERKEKKCKTVALKFLLDVLAIPEVILLVVALFMVLAVVPDDRGIACLYPVMYLFVIVVTFAAYYRQCTEVTDGRKIRLLNTLIHFTFQTSVHHLLWILLGVMTEPLWAIPVLVIICGVLFLINLLAYYYMKTTSNEGPRYNKSQLKTRAVLLVLCVILVFLVLVVVTQSVLGTDPVIGIISAALTTLGSWWMSVAVKNGTGSAKDKK